MKTDLEMLQGEWREVHRERDGVVDPSDGEEGWQPVTLIRDRTFTVTIADGSVVLVGTFELFEERAIDWHDVSGPYASEHVIRAVYELSGDSFAFCAAYEGGPRPRAFGSGPGLVVRRMERVR
jgi:uncharacterized protein (TIGR03067 family)